MTHSHAFPNWPFPDPIDAASYCTDAVARRRLPVLQVAHDDDGDWQFLDAVEDLGEPVLHCLGCVYAADPTLEEIGDLPRGWGAFRARVGAPWERWQKERDTQSDDEQAMANIEAHGLHVLNVAEEGDLPPFSYSIGIQQSLGQPELIVIGLKADVAQAVINECYRQMKSGAAIVAGARVAGLLGGGFECVVGEVSAAHYDDYMGWALWLNKGPNFRAWQIIFPDTAGVFPWEADASEWFRHWQPLLA
jgi:hypothetical protein